MDIKLMVGTPMYGGKADCVFIETVLNIKHWCMKNNVPLEFCFLTDQSSISHARNDIVAEFLESECTHLLFLDSDVGFDVDPSLKKMLDLNLEFVVGSYPKKSIDWQSVVNMSRAGMLAEDVEQRASRSLIEIIHSKVDNDVIPIDRAPAGLMLLKRAVFDKYRNYYGDKGRSYTHKGKTRYNYFGTGVFNDMYLSEDIYFCLHYTSKGERIFFLPSIKAVHEGHYRYKSETTTRT